MNLLCDMVAHPERLAALDSEGWDAVLGQARCARLLGWLHGQVENHCVPDAIPAVVRDTLASDRFYVDYLQLQARREFRALETALAPAGVPVALLKGAAYIHGRLPPGVGRRLADVDILVPADRLEEAESLLLAAGWAADDSLTEYDQNYYRDWSHEVPPLRYPSRSMEVDLHHNLTQPTGRIKLDAALIWQEVQKIDGSPFYRLSDRDLILHSATHLFINDELRGGLRDLVDMHLLASQFSERESFWDELLERADALQLGRPLNYALESLRRLFDTRVPDTVVRRLERTRPNPVSRLLINRAVDNVLAPPDVLHANASALEFFLFVRSHWIRMPPLMLARHLWHKWRFARSGS